jgi:hypothetical protein
MMSEDKRAAIGVLIGVMMIVLALVGIIYERRDRK